MESLEEIVRRISEGNRVSRERFSSLASRTAKAIFDKDRDELNDIIRDATSGELDGESQEGGTEPVEAGNANGPDRTASVEPP